MKYVIKNCLQPAQRLGLLLSFTAVLACFSPLYSQTTVQGSIGKKFGEPPEGISMITVFAKPDNDLVNLSITEMDVCISIPDQRYGNPKVFVYYNYIPSIEWTAAANNPEIIGERAYYTFTAKRNRIDAPSSWLANHDNPVVSLSFIEGRGAAQVQLNDLTADGGIGTGGGSLRKSFWNVQAKTFGDITNYATKFYQSEQSGLADNGGLKAPSSVESTDTISLSPLQAIWQLFPNPSWGNIQLVSGYTELAFLRIFDKSGELVWEKETVLNQSEITPIHLDNLSAGRYMLEVWSMDNRRLFGQAFILLREHR